MDIDEFLDRELSEVGLQTDKAEKPEIMPEFKEEFASPLFENISTNLSKGYLDQAEQSYVQLWHILMQQKLKWSKELYGQLAILSKQFASTLNNASNEVKRKAAQIYELLNKARAALKEGKKEPPFKIYSEVEEIINSIPNAFFEEKKIMQEQIMDFYKELKNTTDNELIKRVSALIQEINQLIDKINTSIRANDMLNAVVNYNKCIELYAQVPEGFLRYKNSIGMRILDIYKSLSIYTEISNLKKQLYQQSMRVPPSQPAQVNAFEQISQQPTYSKTMLLSAKKEAAKRNIEKGFYSEASKDIEEVLRLEPNDAEAKVIHAKIKTLQ